MVPGTHRDVVGQPLGDAELPDLGGDLLPVARLGHADGCQVLTQAEWGCGQQWRWECGVLGRVGKDLPYLRGHAADGGDIVAGVEKVGGV